MYEITLLTTFSEAEVLDDDCISEKKLKTALQVAVSDFETVVSLT